VVDLVVNEVNGLAARGGIFLALLRCGKFLTHDILEILKYNLSNEGYEVITAKDGDEALEKARRNQPYLGK